LITGTSSVVWRIAFFATINDPVAALLGDRRRSGGRGERHSSASLFVEIAVAASGEDRYASDEENHSQ
jgi:hypothetical protein